MAFENQVIYLFIYQEWSGFGALEWSWINGQNGVIITFTSRGLAGDKVNWTKLNIQSMTLWYFMSSLCCTYSFSCMLLSIRRLDVKQYLQSNSQLTSVNQQHHQPKVRAVNNMPDSKLKLIRSYNILSWQYFWPCWRLLASSHSSNKCFSVDCSFPIHLWVMLFQRGNKINCAFLPTLL